MKRKKLGMILIGIAAAVLCAFGASACSPMPDESKKDDSQIYSVYQTYVAHAEANGQTALSYEEWLNSIKGEKGDTGAMGAQGEKGDKGDKGDDGLTPTIGYNGNWWIGAIDTGVKALGEKGDKGDTGATGAQGEKGDKGDTGATGAQGEKGDKGDKGDTGATGAQGVQGEKGDKGDDGADGVGIQSVTVNESGELVITNTKGEVIYQGEIPSCIHTYGEPVDLISTCTVRWVVKECSKCGDTQVTSATPVGHTCGEWLYDESNHWFNCTVCNEKVESEHTYNEQNICTACDYEKGSTAGLSYILANDYYILNGVGTAGWGDIVIPSHYKGLPVKEIGGHFGVQENCVPSITIPDTITNIGKGAFEFGFRRYLKEIIVSENNMAYASQDGILYNKEKTEFVFIPEALQGEITIPNTIKSIVDKAFNGRSGVTSINIPDGITSICNSAFSYCSGLTSITIPYGVTSIGDRAFNGCSGISRIIIPASVTTIGKEVFNNCSGLESITVESGNTKYHSANNCLIETESKTLIGGCKNSVIPSDGSVTSIADRAFSYCAGLTTITIPDGITSIAEKAFIGCTDLTTITISESVTSIGYQAFYGCKDLTSITFSGTIEQWNAITKGYNWNNNTGNYTITCTDGKLDKNGNVVTA